MSTFSVNTKAYPNMGAQWLKEACGIIPHWIMQFDMLERVGFKEFSELKQFMTDSYGFGDLFEFKGSIDPETHEFITQYDDDEPMAPYMTINMKDGRKAHIYPSAFVALPTSDGYFITRMD